MGPAARKSFELIGKEYQTTKLQGIGDHELWGSILPSLDGFNSQLRGAVLKEFSVLQQFGRSTRDRVGHRSHPCAYAGVVGLSQGNGSAVSDRRNKRVVSASAGSKRRAHSWALGAEIIPEMWQLRFHHWRFIRKRGEMYAGVQRSHAPFRSVAGQFFMPNTNG